MKSGSILEMAARVLSVGVLASAGGSGMREKKSAMFFRAHHVLQVHVGQEFGDGGTDGFEALVVELIFSHHGDQRLMVGQGVELSMQEVRAEALEAKLDAEEFTMGGAVLALSGAKGLGGGEHDVSILNECSTDSGGAGVGHQQ